jgi:choline dehydrogenase-like flavoprotein
MGDSTNINLNTKAGPQNHYDAIVIGSGISGGWAAKELCEKGLKVLMLERGRNFEHIKDYKTANTCLGSIIKPAAVIAVFLRNSLLELFNAEISVSFSGIMLSFKLNILFF